MALLSTDELKKVKDQALAEFNDERLTKAKAALKNQLRVVASAELVLQNERRKLEDLEASILEGNL